MHSKIKGDATLSFHFRSPLPSISSKGKRPLLFHRFVVSGILKRIFRLAVAVTVSSNPLFAGDSNIFDLNDGKSGFELNITSCDAANKKITGVLTDQGEVKFNGSFVRYPFVPDSKYCEFKPQSYWHPDYINAAPDAVLLKKTNVTDNTFSAFRGLVQLKLVYSLSPSCSYELLQGNTGKEMKVRYSGSCVVLSDTQQHCPDADTIGEFDAILFPHAFYSAQGYLLADSRAEDGIKREFGNLGVSKLIRCESIK